MDPDLVDINDYNKLENITVFICKQYNLIVYVITSVTKKNPSIEANSTGSRSSRHLLIQYFLIITLFSS